MGFAGVVSLGVVGVVPPALDGDVFDPEEELVVEEPEDVDGAVDLALEDVFVPGNGVNGLRDLPAC